MRKIISILFIFLMLLQAIPVLHFFSARKAIFYTYIDEEKPGDAKETKASKEYLSVADHVIVFDEERKSYPSFFLNHRPSPLLEYLTPPPDAC